MNAGEERNVSSFRYNLAPSLIPFVDECFRNEKINNQGGIIAVTGTKTSKINSTGSCDRFFLLLPYCGIHIKWELVFNCMEISAPPDIIFSSDDEQLGFNPNMDHIKSFGQWAVSDATCLARLIEELLEEYRLHQKSLLSSNQRLMFELNTLTQHHHQYHVDVHCVPANNGGNDRIVRFYVSLKLDLSTLPAYLSKDNPGPECAALLIVFNPPKASKVEPFLFLSPRIERIVGGADSLKLPLWETDSYLIDYVPNVHKLLQEKLDSMTESYVKRKEFFASLLSLVGHAVIEYDTESFKNISFLFEHQGFCFIATLILADRFPQEIPLLSLSSVYYKLGGRPLQCNSRDYPYSPRWDADEKAKRMRQHITDVADRFKELCKTEGEFL